MSCCRYGGTEINYTRTANGKWLPYDITQHLMNTSAEKAILRAVKSILKNKGELKNEFNEKKYKRFCENAKATNSFIAVTLRR